MNKVDFILRIYRDEVNIPVLSYINDITISNITIVSKSQKFGGICLHLGNQKKYRYKVEFSKKFSEVSGSHSSPMLSFKGDYIDIIVRNFPRYPCFTQNDYAARGCLNGWGYTNYINDGFPTALKYRKIEFLTFTP